MRFIKWLSVLSFAVGDREGCRMAPIEAVLIFSGSIKPNELFSSASTFFCFLYLPAAAVCRSSITSALAGSCSLYGKLIRSQACSGLWKGG